MARRRAESPHDPTDQLLGQSPAIQALRAEIRHLAAFDTPGNPHTPALLLQGETGTGKGLVARVMHDSGPRSSRPFIEVNCAAIPDTLLEAELFGYEPGAFSEAKRAKPGLWEAASGGTLFLDEIDSLPLALQGKLLTALEAKRVRRLGAVREQAVDVKLIAAAQAELSGHVQAGRLRADLYHRLAVVVLTLPPLRARGEDILVLARAYVQRYAAAHNIAPKRLSRGAETWLLAHHWPGNVRELSHLLERVMLLSAEPSVDAATFERLSLPQAVEPVETEAALAPGEDSSVDEASRIRQALQQTGGNVVQAARLLGISRSGLRYRMSRYGLGPSGGRDFSAPRIPHRIPATPDDRQDQHRSARGGFPERTASWEQKPVAVLAIDLTFPATVGHEAPHFEPWTLAHRWEQIIVEKVRGFGGVLLQRMSSLLAVAFGVPQALEQLPQRAVQAALAIRQLVAEARFAAGREPTPEVRQALHLGSMLVETQAGAVTERYLAADETLSLAVRLLGHAGAGELMVSPQIGRLIEGWCELQAHEVLLGTERTTPITAYRVDGLVPRRSPMLRSRGQVRSRFVGRERELVALHSLLAQAEGGRGQVVGIVGEPGIGKSRLLSEFHHLLAQQSVRYVEGRCLSYGNVFPYLPVIDVLRDTCGITDTDPPLVMTQRVRTALRDVGIDADETIPYLLYLLGMPMGEDRPAGQSPEALKARMFETLRQMHLRASRQQPLVLVVEDLQWVDRASEEYFTTLVERVSGACLLFITTYRPGYRPPWMGKSYTTQLALPPLSQEDSLCIVHSVLQTEEVPSPLARRILAKAEGNPFFVEELVQALVDQGIFMREPGGKARLAGPLPKRPLSRIQLPPTIQGVLAARIDRLPPEAKVLLHTLAVIGDGVSLRLLAEVVEQPADGLHRLLAQLQRGEFLCERPTLAEPEYTFKHALTQDVAYGLLPGERQRELHEHVAQAIERVYRDRLEEHYSELAHHYQRSGNVTKAVDFLQRAGQQAIQGSANAEAIGHLTAALDLLKTLPDTPARRQQELMLLVALGRPLVATIGFTAPEVEQVYMRALELCRQIGDTPQLFPVLFGLRTFYEVRADLATSRELGAQLLTLAQSAQEPALLLGAHQALGLTCFLCGEVTAARGHLERGIALHKPQEHHMYVALYGGQDPGVSCRGFAIWTLWMLGYPDQALRQSRETIRLARELAHPYGQVWALYFAVLVHQLRREASYTKEPAEEAIALATDQGFAPFLAWVTLFRGWALAMRDHGEEGLGQLRQGLAAWRTMGAEVLRPYGLALLAEALAQVGQLDAGLAVVVEALGLVNATGERFWEAELHRLKGELMLARSALYPTEAEDCFHHALVIARSQHTKSLELRAAMSLARLWQQQGKGAVAREPLAAIYGWFSEGFDTADLREARALLEVLS